MNLSKDEFKHNVAIGYDAMMAVTTGSHNVAIGYDAMMRGGPCPSCGVKWYWGDEHPDNGCDYGVILNVMEE